MDDWTQLRFEERTHQPGQRILGIVFIGLGMLLAALAAWYLWGTGILTAGEQSRLTEAFQERIAASNATAIPFTDVEADLTENITVPVSWDEPTLELDNAPGAQLEAVPDLAGLVPEAAPAVGEPVGRIVIERAGVDWIVVEGVTSDDLRSGPGHMPGTTLPGQPGNAVISGHRTTNGAPFYHLDALAFGDLITVETLIGTHTYRVVDVRVVDPDDTWVTTQWDGAWLTLTTCTPRFSSRNRLIVFASLVDGPNADVIHARYGEPAGLPGS